MLDERVLFAITLVVQFAGLVSVFIARLSEHPRVQLRYQRFFILCLALVGVVGMLAIASGRGCWLLCASTVPLMAVAVTLDTKLAREPIL